jgi:hypothetical protein
LLIRARAAFRLVTRRVRIDLFISFYLFSSSRRALILLQKIDHFFEKSAPLPAKVRPTSGQSRRQRGVNDTRAWRVTQPGKAVQPGAQRPRRRRHPRARA